MKALSTARPPTIEIAGPLRWVLLAAFADPPAGPTEEEAALVASLAGRLGLLERIAARSTDRTLPADLSTTLRRQLNRSAATSLLYEALARELATVSASLGIPLLFLKGFALFLLETSGAGARPFGDLDILVPQKAGLALFEAFRRRGFEALPGDMTEQHLPGLRSPRGGVLEIHFALRGLRRRDSAAVTFDDLRRWQSIDRLAGFEGECFLPQRGLLAAHLLVHALQQHLLRPGSYQLFRVIGDLIDLLPSEDDWLDLETRWQERYVPAIDPSDVRVTQTLCGQLAAGQIPLTGNGGDAGRLLAHLIASSLDRGYAQTLASHYLGRRLAEARRHGELSAYLWRKLFATGDPGEGPGFGLRGVLQRTTRGLLRQSGALLARLGARRSKQTVPDSTSQRSDDPLQSGGHADASTRAAREDP